ncbi:MAG: RNA methyltransferase [Candidatus Marinimicrobia bacterium]|nr:RNA methyltransferase [Candidatus Neomarinimicrobiota bacterium]
MITKAEKKHIQSLHHRKWRNKHSQFIIEGKRLVQEALNAGELFQSVFYTDEFFQVNKDVIEKISLTLPACQKVGDKEMTAIATTDTPSGILAVCYIPEYSNAVHGGNWIYLDDISDPGNMGTLLRTSVWFGIQNIVLSKNCVDVYNPKVVRSGMGAHFYLKSFSNQSLKQFKKSHTIIGADQNGNNINDFEIEAPWVLVLGNEAHGLSKNTKVLLDYTISIPKVGYGESLNVAVAGGILMEKLVSGNWWNGNW